MKLGLASLVGTCLWPGWRPLRGGEAEKPGFTFLVVNDTHYATERCGDWLRGLVAQMRTHAGARFCLHLGDLTDLGRREHLLAVRDVFNGLGVPFHVVPGNHDYVATDDRGPYDEVFPGRLNYGFEHDGWQFLGLDSTHGQRYENTQIPPATFAWLDANLPKLDRARPTVLFTHFPLGHAAKMLPVNADALLERLLDFNLREAFSGHYHAFTESWQRAAALVTNRCCALIRSNHDGTKEKGYWLCSAAGDGRLTREFVEYRGAAPG